MMLTGEQARAGDGGQKSEGYTTELATSADGAEARRAFFEKRKPVFGTAKS
jgi:enoyl-CoA hydratase